VAVAIYKNLILIGTGLFLAKLLWSAKKEARISLYFFMLSYFNICVRVGGIILRRFTYDKRT
jgi:hypothetical protein